MSHGLVPRSFQSSLDALLMAVLLYGTGCARSYELNPFATDQGATSSEASNEASSEPLFYYRDVKPILDSKCGQCHFDGGIGPLPFSTYEEVAPYVGIIRSDVARGIMPPWRASGDLAIFEGDRRLTAEQKEVLTRWIDQGAEPGEAADEPEPLPAPAKRGLNRIDGTLALPEPYAPELDPDTYRCFVFEWPEQQPKYVTGLSVEPSRPELVHHAIVYLTGPSGAKALRDRDARVAGQGFDCFSSVGLGSWLTSYEPGGYGQEFTGGVGLAVEPGSVVLLQVHYNTLNGNGEDSSRIDYTVEDTVERVGRTTLILNTLWTLPVLGAMRIPANQADVVHRWQGIPVGISGPQDIFAVDLHMHTLGSSGSIGIVRAGGAGVETLLDIPDWAFEWQETYRFREPVRLNAGDQLFVECHYDNTAANQLVIKGQRLQPRDVVWGEGTTDEMCLGNVLVTPAR